RDLEQIVDVAPVVLAAEALTLAVQPVLADGLQAGEAEEAVAAVRDGVLGDDVVVALLEAEDAGRVLAAVVNALDVPADAEVQGVARDHVATGAPQPEAPAGEEGAVVVVDLGILDAVEENAVLAAAAVDVVHIDVVRILDVDRCAVARHPLVVVVVMRA